MGTADAGLPDEADLLRRARAGDDRAVEELYAAHADTARTLATVLAGPEAADDMVADAFARVLSQLRAGRGPSENFGSYLYATIRNRYRDTLRRVHREEPASDQPWVLDEEHPGADHLLDELDEDGAVAALATLPHAWQRVLWHLEVEGRRVSEVADLLRSTPEAISSLAYRAREGLKLAYLGLQLGPAPTSEQCGWVQQRLSRYVRGSLTARLHRKIEAHLPTCGPCGHALASLESVNHRLAGLVLPVVLIGGTKGMAASGGVLAGIPVRPGARATTSVSGPVAVGTAAAAAVVVATVAVGAWVDPGDPRTSREPPTARHDPSSAAPSTAPSTSPSVDEVPDSSPTVAPVYQAPPASTAALPSTPPTDAPSPSTPPPSTSTSAPSSPPASPAPTLVTPVAPTASAIEECDTTGTLTLPTTTGVIYTLVDGDGTSGPWTVEASASPGHVIAEGAPARFTGDLGEYHPCPAIASTGATEHTNVSGSWNVTVAVDASGPVTYPILVRMEFDVGILVQSGSVTGEGWACWVTDGESRTSLADTPFPIWLAPGTAWVECEYDYDGTDPPDVTVNLLSPDGRPDGTARLFSDGTERDPAAI